MKVYVASSWRNTIQPEVVDALRTAGHEVYDFRNPAPGNSGFAWSDLDLKWKEWDDHAYREALDHPLAREGLRLDMTALRGCEACVLVQPCGISAHLEFGWAVGAGRLGVVLLPGVREPELMIKMADVLCLSMDEVIAALASAPECAAKDAQLAMQEPPTGLSIDMQAKTVGALIGMVCQDLDGHEPAELEREFGIKPPHREFVSVHLGFHAEALRVLGALGVMDIDDRGGRCVLGDSVREDVLDLTGVIPGWKGGQAPRIEPAVAAAASQPSAYMPDLSYLANQAALAREATASVRLDGEPPAVDERADLVDSAGVGAEEDGVDVHPGEGS